MKCVNKQIAETLQELGYDGEYRYFHVTTTRGHEVIYTAADVERLSGHIVELCAAPRLDDVAYWLREKCGLCICIFPNPEAECKNEAYVYNICQYYDNDEYWSLLPDMGGQLTYTDALEVAVNKAVEIIKEKKL